MSHTKNQSLLLRFLSYPPFHNHIVMFLPQPLPNIHQRLPQQILTPPHPILLRITLTKPYTPNPIHSTSLNQLPIPSRQQHSSQILRILRDSELVVVTFFHDAEFIYTALVYHPESHATHQPSKQLTRIPNLLLKPLDRSPQRPLLARLTRG